MSLKRAIAVSAMAAVIGCGGNSGDNGPGGSVQFSISGEVLALDGYPFPPASDDDVAFVDGWEVKFDKLLAVIDNITLAENPDVSVADESRFGKVVARVPGGPWAVDLHQGGSLPGKGGGDEQAYPIAVVENQNQNGNKPFDPTMRYAFSFDTVAAIAGATRLQIAEDDPDYGDMVTNGWAALYVGTATFKGTNCVTSDNSFDFSRLPTTVHFRLGFASPTSYLNCQNPDNDPAAALGEEEHERGVQIKANSQTVAQVTIHTDHPFWQSFMHDSPVRFDALAALAEDVGGVYTVTMADTAGVDYHTFTYGAEPLPWRQCVADATPSTSDPQMGYDDLGTTVADFQAYLTYNQSTQGHLNSDGLCFVKRNY